MHLIDKINSLQSIGSVTKQEKIVQGISECIADKELLIGEMLPSVNEMSKKLSYSRETVVKAYKVLKERGIINSKHGLGYFVANDVVDKKLNIALFLYGFQIFQQVFYNTFRKTLGEDYQIDVFFHHNNIEMYKSMLANTKNRYGKYVVAPIQSDEGQEALSVLPASKLLLIDRFLDMGVEVSSITQEFEQPLSVVFEQLKKRIDKFERFIIYYRDDVDYPESVYRAFLAFCKKHAHKAEVYPEYEESHLAKGTFYMTIGDSDLWLLLKDAKRKNYELGHDLGILSHNDSPVKEIIEGGITTFSTDFELMAKLAAEAIIENKEIKKIVPNLLIRRKSL